MHLLKSKEKISRRLGVNLFLKGERSMSPKSAAVKRPYPPGAHGQKRQRKLSEYALQLREKQKVRFTYGVSERALRNIFAKASKSREKTGEKLLEILERRLDNVVYRAGLAKSRGHARQLVSHGFIMVDKKKVNVPSFKVQPKQVISMKKTPKDFEVKKDAVIPSWLKLDKKSLKVEVLRVPTRIEVGVDVDEKLIVEFYSR
jgi:small subunit ribosomal protein S4